MKLQYEVMIQKILPEVRSIIAKELVCRHRLSQAEAAELMGISQPAVSQYINNIRGKNRLLEKKEVLAVVQELARNIHDRKVDETKFVSELFRIYKLATRSASVHEVEEQLEA